MRYLSTLTLLVCVLLGSTAFAATPTVTGYDQLVAAFEEGAGLAPIDAILVIEQTADDEQQSMASATDPDLGIGGGSAGVTPGEGHRDAVALNKGVQSDYPSPST